jgi:nucleotide-binding universal stress UspA family protein
MINKILVPTDFSKVANNALQYAIELAKKFNAEICLLHVKYIPMLDPQMPAETYRLFADETEQAAKENFKKTEDDVLSSSSVKYTTHMLTGYVTDEILHFAKNNAVDLIVMGTTGASGLQELLVGSNTASVVGRTETPLWVVPPDAKCGDIKDILYATDYTEPEFPAFSRLSYIAQAFQSDLTVLHAKTDFDKYFNSANNFFVRNKASISLKEVTIIQSEKSDILATMEEYAQSGKYQLISVAKHNRSWFDKLFHRSLSKRMAYHTKVPLLVVHK